MAPPTNTTDPSSPNWQRLKAASARAFHTYASWLVSISWKRFFVLAVLLVVAMSILQSLPPFSLRITETVVDRPQSGAAPQSAPASKPPAATQRTKPGDGSRRGVDISIDEGGVRITPRGKGSPSAASGAAAAGSSDPASAAAGGGAAAAATAASPIFEIRFPENLSPEARKAIDEAITDAKDAIEKVLREHEQAASDAGKGKREVEPSSQEGLSIALPGGRVHRTRLVRWGDFLTDLALLWVVASIIIKATYKGRIQAEAKAAQATETAGAEALKRQVVEARMAAMQAQVEPHFLFNTLASIDHLIETEPARASVMQKNLIALLRASMPTMREANATGPRELSRELAVIRPYLEILKVRMEERLSAQINVADGLLSAEFPPMMIQSLVENAIKHGLEPKPEGGSLLVKAEVVHGKLAVSVADTGMGFGVTATAGSGVGLANIRERLALIYGDKATLTISPNTPSGTVVTVTVPYRAVTQTT